MDHWHSDNANKKDVTEDRNKNQLSMIISTF